MQKKMEVILIHTVAWGGISRTVDAPHVSAGDVESPHHPQHLPLAKVIDDRQHQQVVLHEQFHGSIQRVLGLERMDVGAHQVGRQDERLHVGGLRGQIDLLQVDHAQQTVLAVDHRQDGIGVSLEAIEHLARGIAGMERQDALPGFQELAHAAPARTCRT